MKRGPQRQGEDRVTLRKTPIVMHTYEKTDDSPAFSGYEINLLSVWTPHDWTQFYKSCYLGDCSLDGWNYTLYSEQENLKHWTIIELGQGQGLSIIYLCKLASMSPPILRLLTILFGH